MTEDEIEERIGLENVDVFRTVDGRSFIAQLTMASPDGSTGAYFLGLRADPTDQEIADVRARFQLWQNATRARCTE